ncbi:hypothetical protein Tco_1337462 [Tanacetum coccineum]
MSSPKFAEMHNVVVFLEKPEESDRFAEIIDFLKASSVSYALTVNPVIYTSYIEQFWATTKVQTVNEVRQLQALVDKKKVTVTESSIRRDLHLDDVEGTDCLPTATIFEELARMGAKSTAWNEFSSSMGSLIICLATNQKFNLSKYIFDAMVKHLDGGVKLLMKDFSRRITPLFDTMMVQPVEEMGEDSDHPTNSTHIPIIDQPSSSSQPKKKQPSKKAQRQEADVPQDKAEHEKCIPTPSNDPQPSAKDAQAKEIVALKKRIQRLERRKMSRPTGLKRLRKVGTKDQESLSALKDASKQGRSIDDIDADVDVTLVDETQERQDDDLMFDTGVLEDDAMLVEAKDDGKGSVVPTTIEEITLAQTLIQIKAAKPKVVTTAATTTTTIRPKDRRVVIQEPIPLKRKDQIALDEQIARDIQAKLDAESLEEQKLARKQEEEANIALIESWKNTQAMMEADRLLAERLQSKEREELTDEEKEKLFMKLMEKRRKHFHMGGYTYKQLKGKSFNEIQNLFDKEMKRVNTFVAMGFEVQESKEKKEEEKESNKVDEVDEAELKKLLVIKKDEDIAIDAIPLATKLPVIINYKLHKKGMIVHYQLIRADGSSKRYSSMIRMLQGINRWYGYQEKDKNKDKTGQNRAWDRKERENKIPAVPADFIGPPRNPFYGYIMEIMLSGKSKEVRTPRYLSLVVPLKKIGDKAVHKELGDRMERAATTTSSLEVEQDSEGSEDFHQIIDFLNISHIKYALTENPTIYTSLVQQFWETSSASTLENQEMEIIATIDGRVKTITEASIRRHLKPEDSDGIPTLPNAEIFEQLALIGPNKTAWEQFSSNIATVIICLAINRTFNFSKMIFEEEPATMPYNLSQPRVQSLASDKGSLTLNELMVLCTTLSKKVEDFQNDLKQTKLTYGAAYTKLILRVKKLEHKERTSADTAILLELEKPTELVEDLGSGEKGEKEISTAKVLVSTASAIPEINEEERQRIASDAEIAKQLQEEIDIARKEQEKYDLAQALELQKELDKRKEGVAETTQAYDIDWSDPAMLRYHVQQNRSFSKAEVRKNMCMYLKNQGGYKQSHFKGMSYEDIRPIFERVGEVSGSVEEQSIGKEKEVSEEELKKLLVIVPVEEVYIEALQVKYPIIDWGVFIEESRSYWRIIRVGNHTEVYQLFEYMLKRFDRDDLEKLWDLVKKKFSLTEPTIDKEKIYFSSDKMEAGTTTTNLTARLPILNPADYDLWLMRIEKYFLMTDYWYRMSTKRQK